MVTHIRGHEVVPESVLRRRKSLAEIREKREETLAAQRIKRSNKPKAGVLFKKAAAFVKDYRQKFASGTRFTRENKKLRRISNTIVEPKLVSRALANFASEGSRFDASWRSTSIIFRHRIVMRLILSYCCCTVIGNQAQVG